MALSIFYKIVLFVSGLLIAFLLFSIINHKYHLKIESRKYPPPGEILQISNNKMHLYSRGQGDIALVFMSGHGTCCPTIDFKPIWMRMSDEYRIIIVEKAGYGWSETSSHSRDIDTMLEETRQILSCSGETGPYVLIPHSMSGLEAIYWAQRYPDEVKAIIGLDPAVPDAYTQSLDLFSQKKKLKIMYFILKTGLSRFMNSIELEKNLPLITSTDLSGDDINNLIAIFHRSAITKNMLNEIDFIPENAQKVKSNGIPVNTPMYFFISDASDVNIPCWKEKLSDYISHVHFGQFQYLDTGHYVHHEKAEIIAYEAKRFLKKLDIN